MLSIRVAALAACGAALAPTPTATPRQRLRTRRSFGGFKLPNIENPFDDRPGATVGKLQIALANEDMSATRVVADCAARFERDRSRAALPKFIHRGHRRASSARMNQIVPRSMSPRDATPERWPARFREEGLSERLALDLCKKGTPRPSESASTRAASSGRPRDAYENLERGGGEVRGGADAVQRGAGADSEGVRGMCVVSIVVCLEGDETECFATRRRPRRGRGARCATRTRCVEGGDLVLQRVRGPRQAW